MELSNETVNAKRLVLILLNQWWHKNCEIIPDPDPTPRIRSKVVVQHGSSVLRYRHGPQQGFFWDIYGDTMQTVELASVALSKAPAPPDVGLAGK